MRNLCILRKQRRSQKLILRKCLCDADNFSWHVVDLQQVSGGIFENEFYLCELGPGKIQRPSESDFGSSRRTETAGCDFC